jgi:hypothetical protein
MAERDVTGKTGEGISRNPEREPGTEAPQREQEDLSGRGPEDPRILEIGRSLEKGEVASPANQESSAGIVSRG